MHLAASCAKNHREKGINNLMFAHPSDELNLDHRAFARSSVATTQHYTRRTSAILNQNSLLPTAFSAVSRPVGQFVAPLAHGRHPRLLHHRVRLFPLLQRGGANKTLVSLAILASLACALPVAHVS